MRAKMVNHSKVNMCAHDHATSKVQAHHMEKLEPKNR